MFLRPALWESAFFCIFVPMRKLFLLLACLLPLSVRAQENSRFTLDADFFTRGEVRRGGTGAPDGAGADGDFAAFILGRTRLGAQYDWWAQASAEKPVVQLKVDAQYFGTWGGKSTGDLSVYEAWLQLNFGRGFFARLGRQNLSYDDQRIFGSDDWSMTGLSHDALKLGYERGGHKLHTFFAFNQNLMNIGGGTYYVDGLQPYKAMEALWYHYDVPSFPLGISLLAANMGMQGGTKNVDEKTFQQQILGAHLRFHPSQWNVEAAYYHQLGKAIYGADALPINAWMAAVKAVFSPLPAWSFRLGYDFLSGDEAFPVPGQGQMGLIQHKYVGGFSSLYGSSHNFYGAMDFFYVRAYVNGFSPGLQNAFVGVNWRPVPGLSVDAAYHFLATSVKLLRLEMPLGHEVEMAVSYSINKWMSVSAGYTFMHGTDTMVALKRSGEKKRLHWGWIMFRAAPRLLNVR